MANPVWPDTLPQYVNESGYNESEPDTLIETPFDAGPTGVRNRFTTASTPLRVAIDCTADQATIFRDFYRTTLANGSIPFDWFHPRTRENATLRFRKPVPTYGTFGGINVRITMALEIVE